MLRRRGPRLAAKAHFPNSYNTDSRRQDSLQSRQVKRQQSLKLRRDRPVAVTPQPAFAGFTLDAQCGGACAVRPSLLQRLVKGDAQDVERACLDLCGAFNQYDGGFKSMALRDGVLRKLALQGIGEGSSPDTWPSQEQAKPVVLALAQLVLHANAETGEVGGGAASGWSAITAAAAPDKNLLALACRSLGVLLRCAGGVACCADEVELAPALLRLAASRSAHPEVVAAALAALAGATAGGDRLALSLLGITAEPGYAGGLCPGMAVPPLLQALSQLLLRPEPAIRRAACAVLAGAASYAAVPLVRMVCSQPKLVTRVLQQLGGPAGVSGDDDRREAAVLVLSCRSCDNTGQKYFPQKSPTHYLFCRPLVAALSQLLSTHDARVLDTCLSCLECVLGKHGGGALQASYAAMVADAGVVEQASDLARIKATNASGGAAAARAAALLDVALSQQPYAAMRANCY
ncbi:hypothetical protein JKP88DRAFT_263110 [Tribonema minus]|uniref:Uncharacterized protein n=1 Tax=Tribonema minus TaxID=303371 RepID=A0A835YWF9_9STRA|nr:hypothetical protein JKP88DRAFT_263110 [Tribonema minus]